MKKSIFLLGALFFIVAGTQVSCTSSAEKVEKAQENVTEANVELDKAHQAYLDDYNDYVIRSNQTFVDNDKAIVEFRKRIATEKAEAKKDYEMKIEALENKNSDLKLKLENYKEDGKDKWESFKEEFNHDMSDLGDSFKSFTKNDVK